MNIKRAARPLDNFVNGLFAVLITQLGMNDFAVDKINSTLALPLFNGNSTGIFIMSLQLNDIGQGETGHCSFKSAYVMRHLANLLSG